MATIIPCGARRPAGLDHLIAEGILPRDPLPHQYTCKFYASVDQDLGEEVLFAKDCVVYSKGGYVRRILRFDADNGPVRFAELTCFHASAATSSHAQKDQSNTRSTTENIEPSAGLDARPFGHSRRSPRKQDALLSQRDSQPVDLAPYHSATRALTVFISKLCYVIFIEGRTHTLSVPFEVEAVFASHSGIIVQRKTQAQPIPQNIVPAPPPNSFRTSQLQAFPFGSAKRKAGHGFDLGKFPFDMEVADSSRLMILCDPLAGFSSVASATVGSLPRHLRLNDTDLLIDYDDFDDDETLIYVSSTDELAAGPSAGTVAPLLILVTANEDLGQLTIWQGWTTHTRSLSALNAIRKSVRASRARRRSSVNTPGSTLGTATPTVRFHDKGRESFAAGALLPPGRSSGRRPKQKVAAKVDDDEVTAMALRLDPEYHLPKQSLSGVRRTGSILSRGDLTGIDSHRIHSTTNASFAKPTRRGPTFRASVDRRSIGTSIYRKSRGSVSGSVFSRSMGPDVDDTMDIDWSEHDQETERAAQLYLATNDFSSIDSAFSGGLHAEKPGFIARKVHVHGLGQDRKAQHSEARQSSRFKVCTTSLKTAVPSQSHQLTISIQDRLTDKTVQLNFAVVTTASTEVEQSEGATYLSREQIAVPIFLNEHIVNSTIDIAKLGGVEQPSVAILLKNGDLQVSQNFVPTWQSSFPLQARYFDRADVRISLGQAVRDVGARRTVPLRGNVLRIDEAIDPNSLALTKDDGTHMVVSIGLEPRHELVRRALHLIKLVLPLRAASMSSHLWRAAYEMLGNTPGLIFDDYKEVQALFMAILAYAIGSLRPGSNRKRQQKDPSTLRNVVASGAGKALRQSAKPWSAVTQATRDRPAAPFLRSDRPQPSAQDIGKVSFNTIEANTRRLLHRLANDNAEWLLNSGDDDARAIYSLKILLTLQMLREDMALSSSRTNDLQDTLAILSACIAQLGHYLSMPHWSWSSETNLAADFGFVDWDFSSSAMLNTHALHQYEQLMPFSIIRWLDDILRTGSLQPLPTLHEIASILSQPGERIAPQEAKACTPHLYTVSSFFQGAVNGADVAATTELIFRSHLTKDSLEKLPEGLAAYLQEFIAECQTNPPSAWPATLLHFIGRDDILPSPELRHTGLNQHQHQLVMLPSYDIQAIVSAAERTTQHNKSNAAERNVVAAHLFSEDRRLVDASNLINPATLQIADCPAQPGWTDIDHLDEQKRVMVFVMKRTIALPIGHGMFFFESQKPLLSERFHVPGFSMHCQMKPMDNTISADRTNFSEEKLNWAFFHAGTSAGLNISRKATGIDTSWILFNKPLELTNRHAGFLFALGLNGHLRTMAKWLAFKYLTPKHTMTSIGLLLGLSASHMGTMDTLITRMLSVHITRMLPPGAAELNVSPLTQTAGLVGIGLLYYNTQHRRMSEIMLSELEHRELDEASGAPNVVQDESYRLAAGISLGLINLGKGDNLHSLQGMSLLERLLSIAVGPRPVELVHVVDKATAGAILAIAFIYMKTGDVSIASKIDVPGTASQLDHVRPDVLLLRTLAKNLIMWNDIKDERGWIRDHISSHAALPKSTGVHDMLPLQSANIPLYNIITGHAWSLSIRYAGSASTIARDEVLEYLDIFLTCAKQEASFYDGQLTRTTLRRCIDVLALSAATIMAGTGDLVTLRYLRSLHGRTDAETTYGSHMAAHLAMGTLFLGGGTYTFSTSNIAIASLVTAFYPLFPSDVLDNAVHLQALRQLWVLAAEARCAVCIDVDSGRVVPMLLRLAMKTGKSEDVKSPSLLPDLATIASIETLDMTYWKTLLDFKSSGNLLKRFRQDQTIFVRKAPRTEASPLVFSQALTVINEKQNMPPWFSMWTWLLQFPAMKVCIDQSELDLVLPVNERSAAHVSGQGTVLDSRLTLWCDAMGANVQRLRNVRMLLEWAEKKRLEDTGRLKWLGNAFVERLEAVIEQRMGLL